MTIFLAAAIVYQQPSTLADDPRLAKPVAIRAEAQSLAEVLKQFQTATGVAIEASVPLRDDLVTIYTADKPAGQSLANLAGHFGWTWQSSNNGYFLVQTQEARKAEEAKRRELRIRDFTGVRDDYKQRLQKLKTLDLKEYEKRLAALSRQLEKDPRNQELRKQVYAEYTISGLAHDPYERFVAEVFITIPDAKLEELATRGRIVLNYYPTPAQSPLGRGARAAEALIDALSKPIEPPDPKQLDNEDYMPPPKPINRSAVASVRVAVETNRGGMWSTSSASVNVLSKQRTILDSNIIGLRDGSEEKVAKRELQGEPFTGNLRQTPELKQRLDFRPQDENELILRMLGGFFSQNNSEPLAQDAWFLTETAKCLGLPVIADAYDTHTQMMRPKVPQGKTALAIFSSALDTRQGVSFTDGWLRVRDEDWQLARAMTVPRRILLPLRDTYVKQGGLTFDQLASAAARLTDLQAASPVLLIAAGMEMSGLVLADVETLCILRFWDAISPFQKRALQSGSALDLRSLSPMARSNIIEYVYRSGSSEENGRDGMFNDDDQESRDQVIEAIPASPEGFDPMAEAEEQVDTEITQILPTGPLQGASVSLEFKTRAGVSVIIGNDRVAVPFSIPISAVLDFREFSKEMPFLKLKGARPALLSSYHFSILCSPQVARTFNASTGWSDPIFKYGALESLPADTLAKLAEMERKREERRRKQEQPPPPSTVPLGTE